MRNIRKFLLLIIGILICLLIFFTVQIYAKYLTSASGSTGISIASWNISVNNNSIKNNSDISSSIVPIFLGSEHISSNIIAPTAKGYFDLNFNFSDADVSFKYEINVCASENSPVSDLFAVGYSIDDGEEIVFDTFNQTISDEILLRQNITTRKIRVFIVWNDDSNTSTMSNEDDTQSTISTIPALLDVNVSFTQIVE